MIVNEADAVVELIPQHEHARISAEILKNWKEPGVRANPLWNALWTAVREHDRAWIPLDASPWLNERQIPYSFTHYPEPEKITAYQHGIEAAASLHIYSGLLVSRHYAAFFASSTTEEGQNFFRLEKERQQKLREELGYPAQEEDHLKLLQFCDDVSLYACMNTPGVSKDEEIEWFQNGFRHSFAFLNNETIQARFKTKESIQLHPFPLQTELKCAVHGVKVEKKDITKTTAHKILQNGEPSVRPIRFVP
ncbi:DUF3891 family protein [Salibacterium aidingense]|uniref:DUF3891 family protein n=1 Tax=Salibacterium aidingense TaxID=384933 RepID=UPI0003F98531|nr:DUF3891 family protein [Salibacterium aidingense]